jgi:hypothetical protein
MKHIAFAIAAIALLCYGCTPVVSHATIHSTPETALDCAGGLLGSMGYQLVDREEGLRAERARHAAFGHQRADYDRISVAVADGKLYVRGETVAMSGGSALPAFRSVDARTAGGATVTLPTKELRADVKRLSLECGVAD